MTQVQVVHRVAFDGTIDGHDPLAVTFRIKGKDGWFRLTVITWNLGRGYTPEQFRNNVKRVLNQVGEREYVVLLLQEIDEGDLSPEHKIILQMLQDEFGSFFRVEWWTREPIAVMGKGVKVEHTRKTMTMDQGSAIGAPKGTGPRRFIVWCVITIEGVRIGLANQHPHRVDPDWSSNAKDIVRAARARGEKITRRVIGTLVRICDVVIDGMDANDLRYPRSHPRQRTVYKRGLDYIRCVITERNGK